MKLVPHILKEENIKSLNSSRALPAELNLLNWLPFHLASTNNPPPHLTLANILSPLPPIQWLQAGANPDFLLSCLTLHPAG